MKNSLTKTLILTTVFTLSSYVQAQTKSAAPAPSAAPVGQAAEKPQVRTSDKVDLKKLEEKYWSAKDEDYSVIQNRLYSKAGRIYVSGVYGTLVNDPFAKSNVFGGHLGYYFTEDFGVEASYLGMNATKSDSVSKFNTLAANISPNYNLPSNAVTVSATYTPFYAKMAFMNTSILYFDMGFTLGAGMTSYNQVIRSRDNMGNDMGEGKIGQSAPHVELGVMQQLFLSKYFAVRLDLKNSFYTEKIITYDAGISGVRSEESNTKNNTMLTLGMTLFF